MARVIRSGARSSAKIEHGGENSFAGAIAADKAVARTASGSVFGIASEKTVGGRALGDITNISNGRAANGSFSKPLKASVSGPISARAPLVDPLSLKSSIVPPFSARPPMVDPPRTAFVEDAADTENPQSVTEYVEDIYTHLREEEVNDMPRADYMEDQLEINSRMRAILCDWLVEVHMKYKLRLETLFLTVNLLDRSLDQRQTMRQKLQLVGVAAMLIASKFEEINPPEISDFVYITDNAYTKEDILQMEVVILTDLKFDICIPTPAHFMERYQRLNQCPKDSVHCHLLHYILELSLMNIQMIRYEPSHLVAAATLLSNKLMQQPSWPPMVAGQCKFDLPAVKECAEDLFGLLEAAQKSPMQAVRNKFSHEKYRSVATRSIICGGLLA